VSGLHEQLLDNMLGFGIVTFAEVVVPSAALRVDEVVRGPVHVVEGAPDCVVIVDSHGVIDFQIDYGLLHITDVLLEGKFRRMYANNNQSMILVLLGPRAEIRDCSEAVDAGVSPEIDQHDLAPERFGRERRAIEPLDGTTK
jgi:hypothetical protein